jgi:hypothetical protein
MLTLAVTLLSGEQVRLDVIQAEFVRECPYCKLRGLDMEFRTIDPDQIYCKPSHSVRMSEWRRYFRSA